MIHSACNDRKFWYGRANQNRMRLKQAPFDHPPRVVPHGHADADAQGIGHAIDLNFEGAAKRIAPHIPSLPP